MVELDNQYRRWLDNPNVFGRGQKAQLVRCFLKKVEVIYRDTPHLLESIINGKYDVVYKRTPKLEEL